MLNNLRYKISQFMAGRYGMDQFSQFLGWLAFVLIVIGMFSKKALFTYLTLAVIIYMYFRVLSKDHAKRFAENQKYLQLSAKARGYFTRTKYRISDLKTHHIYKCPTCKQKIRIPRGKGRIEISCPKCRTKFIKNS